ncbi:hypothetical protein BGX29_001812 [Mortierella sp. GBA35]|nr:hypothetical protein BGX29_001812 [Mortierella sp. GBA35]
MITKWTYIPPELVLIIGSHLNVPDLARCIRTYTEQLARQQVLADRVLGMDGLEELALTSFHIRQGAQNDAFLKICQRLRTLEMSRVNLDVDFPRQASITSGSTDESNNNINNNGTFTLPRLRKLVLQFNAMKVPKQLALWRACTHLEDLTWHLSAVNDRSLNTVNGILLFELICDRLSDPPLSMTMARSLVRLELPWAFLPDNYLARLLRPLPNLQVFIADYTKFGPTALAVLLGDEPSNNDSNNDSNNSNNSGNNGNNNNSSDNSTGSRGQRAHLWRELSLRGCDALTGMDIQRILSSCSSLKVFRGSSIYISQMISPENLYSSYTDDARLPLLEPTTVTTATFAAIQQEHEHEHEPPLTNRPWVCSGLEELDLQILLCTEDESKRSRKEAETGIVPRWGSETMRVRRGLVYIRLASLKRLRSLSLKRVLSEESGNDEFGLDMSLKYGLAKLAPLRE